DFDPGVEDPDPSSLSGPLPRLLRRSKAVGAGIPGCAIPRGSLSHKFLRARSWALPRFSRSCLDSPRPTCRMPPMPIRPRALLPALLGLLLAAPAAAQDEYVVNLSQIDPSAILASAGDVLMRAPDAAIDDLFQATHAAAQKPEEAKIL